MSRRQRPGIKVYIQRRVTVEDGHADHRLGVVAEGRSQEVGKPESGHHVDEAHLWNTEAMCEAGELLLVVGRCEDMPGVPCGRSPINRLK